MDITFLGHDCFRLRGREVSLVTDPFGPAYGVLPPRFTAEIVTVSHNHEGHNYVDGVEGVVRVLYGPGEYEVRNVLIAGVATYHDDKRGQEAGRNTVYVVELDDIRVCHLGDLGHLLTAEQVDEIGTVDVLLVPVGGRVLSPARVAEVISQLEPSLVIPMNYTHSLEPGRDEALARFCHEMGVTDYTPEPRLSVTKSNLPSETQIRILNPTAAAR